MTEIKTKVGMSLGNQMSLSAYQLSGSNQSPRKSALHNFTENHTSIEELKSIPIADIAVRLGIELDRHGKALCFKGHDKKPSLSINTRGNYFRCFGCNIGGSGIDLVKEYRGCSLREAIAWLQQEFAIPEEKCRRNSMLVQEKNKHHISKNGREYSEVYRHLIELSDVKEAIKYLEGRGINRSITQQAGLRVIPKNIEHIKRNLIISHGIKRLIDSGIFSLSRTGKPYFAFCEHRLMIPYFNFDGHTILALQGRNIDTGDNPKYRHLSGVETVPFNLRALKEAGHGGNIYLCEGVIDALSCYQLELYHPIAISGVNNFKPEYFKILEPYRLIIASDRDRAGEAFYLRIKKEYLKWGKEIYALDYAHLKADYNITDDVKDLNDIALKADYKHYRKTKPKWKYSTAVNDIYTERDGGIYFNSGVFYTHDELVKLEGITQFELKAVHSIKRIFNGTLL